jgi:hypothetical protein
VYALHCYNDAIAHVPEDLRVYSSIVDDIAAARLQRVRVPSAHNGVSQNQKTSSPNQALFKEAFNKIGPRNADSVPLPLLILGAGGAGLISRRLRTRRAPAS